MKDLRTISTKNPSHRGDAAGFSAAQMGHGRTRTRSVGETPQEALLREVGEELGITDFAHAFIDKYVFESARERELVHVFRCTYDGPIRPSAEELDGGRFWTMDEVCTAIGHDLLTPNFESEFQRCFIDRREVAKME